MDAYFGRALKNWAARKRPPEDVRARLLQAAEAEAALPSLPVRISRRVERYHHPLPKANFGHLLMSNMHPHNLTIIALRLT